jgi:hypothetical protein
VSLKSGKWRPDLPLVLTEPLSRGRPVAVAATEVGQADLVGGAGSAAGPAPGPPHWLTDRGLTAILRVIQLFKPP